MKAIISDMLRSSRWMVIDRNAGTLVRALELVESVRAPFWDALIAACMLENGISTIVTENETDF